MYVSLKIIDKINSIIENEEIENIKYDPLPISNMCCLSDINLDYDYNNFFDKKDVNKEYQNLIDISYNLENINKKINNNKLEITYVRPMVKEQKLKSFTNVFPKK